LSYDRIIPMNKPMLTVCFNSGEDTIFKGVSNINVRIEGVEYNGVLVEVNRSPLREIWLGGQHCYGEGSISKSYLLEQVKSKEQILAEEAVLKAEQSVEKAKAALKASQDVLNKLKEK
jgi:hypothetical protein